MFTSFSRTAWLGCLLGIVVIVVLYNYKLIIYVPLTLLVLLIPKIKNRFLASFTNNYSVASSLDGRKWAITNGFYIFKQHLLLGSGPGSYGGKLAANYASPVYLEGIQKGYTALYYTDNQFLEILVQGGILGFLSFCGFVVAAFVNLMRQYFDKNDLFALFTAGAFICFLFSGLFANVLEYGAIAVPMGLILGASFNEG